ncbi:MAG: hypothetical protein JW779_05990 [Candidatus Thorarchaeota archaeon]|nr:hypothetical protein [Candidatus Thorarchaeota archaeon]
MIRRKISSFPIILILFSLTFISVSIPSCSANYANWGIMVNGTSFNNGSHISMPFADVQINITRTASVVYTALTSEFHITTNTTQNATLAFVYPSPIPDRLLYEENSSMQIYGNGSLYNYTVYEYDDFADDGFSDNFMIDYPFVQPWTSFAVFDIELTANTTMILSTISNTDYLANMDKFEYHYIVGSARTFEGHTIEHIHFHVVEQVPFSSSHFYPNESLSIVKDGIVSDALWDLNITEFSFDIVGFDAEYQDQLLIFIQTISVSGFVIFIIFIIYQFGYKKSKSTG